jgi:hypothetical protein
MKHAHFFSRFASCAAHDHHQVFALHHAEAGADVCARLRDSICATATPLHACIARLLLLSDILFNR